MNYYCIFTDQSGLNGVPIFFETRIFEKETKDPFKPKNSVYYDWMRPGFDESPFADPLYLYTKNNKVAFDYYYNQTAFVLSKEFLKVADQFNKKYRSSKLHILPWKDDKEFKIEKEYRYVHYDYTSADEVVNYEKSKYDFTPDDDGNPLVHNGVKYVSQYHTLVFNENINQDLFFIKDTLLSLNLFCSENFKIAAEKAQLYGLMFVPVEEWVDFMEHSGFLGKDNYEKSKFGK